MTYQMQLHSIPCRLVLGRAGKEFDEALSQVHNGTHMLLYMPSLYQIQKKLN